MSPEPGPAQLLKQRRSLPPQHAAYPHSPLPQGFGNPAGEHWLGNEVVHQLTSRAAYSLRVELQDWEGNEAYAQYEHFQLGSEGQLYRWAWGPGSWVGWETWSSGYRVCTNGQSLGVSSSCHLSPIWAHVMGSGGGWLALSTSWPLGGVERMSLTLPCQEQEGAFQGQSPRGNHFTEAQKWGGDFPSLSYAVG